MMMLIMKSLDYMDPLGADSQCWLQKMAKKPHEKTGISGPYMYVLALKIFRVTLSTILKQRVLL